MSLSTSIAAGTLLGAVAAFAVYTATAPGEDAVVAPVAAVVAPVPTPTVTQLADGCEPPAVLTGDECVTHDPWSPDRRHGARRPLEHHHLGGSHGR